MAPDSNDFDNKGNRGFPFVRASLAGSQPEPETWGLCPLLREHPLSSLTQACCNSLVDPAHR